MYDTFEFLKLLPRSTELKWGGGRGEGFMGSIFQITCLTIALACYLTITSGWVLKRYVTCHFCTDSSQRKLKWFMIFHFWKSLKKMLCLCICCCVFCTACFGIFKCITIAHYVDFKVKKCAVFACIKTCHVQTAIIQMHRCLFRVLDAT